MKPANRRNISRHDITAAPGWQELSELEQKEATDAARQFLVEHNDQRDDPNKYTDYAEAVRASRSQFATLNEGISPLLGLSAETENLIGETQTRHFGIDCWDDP